MSTGRAWHVGEEERSAGASERVDGMGMGCESMGAEGMSGRLAETHGHQDTDTGVKERCALAK